MLADMAVNQADLAGRAAAPERAGAAPMAGPDQGLSAAEAAQRLAREGPNALPGGQRRSLLSIAVETVREPMFLLLLAAGSLYLVFGDLQEGLTLFGFVVVTLALTLYQEGKTERAIEALRDLTSPRALVIRDGQPQRIAGRDVVRGDLLKLSEGDRVPADALLVSADGGVRADESLLTGEAVPVGKRVALPGERAALAEPAGSARAAAPGGDDLPLVYAGTLIVQGHALANVTATGARSEIGRIGAALGTVEHERSPLQKQTARLVRNLALLALALSLALVVVHGLIKGDWLQALLAGIALAMAMLPEEYPVVLTVFPALGARRLSKDGVLTAIETLGATTVLCSDKTGTLTENRMTVTHLAAGGVGLPDRLALDALADGNLPEAFHQLGARFLRDTGHLHRDWRLVQTYALSPALRAMSHVWAAGDGARVVHGPGLAGDRTRLRFRIHRVARSGRSGACRGACRRGGVPGGRHPRGHDRRGLPGHGAGHCTPGRTGWARRRGAVGRRDGHPA